MKGGERVTLERHPDASLLNARHSAWCVPPRAMRRFNKQLRAAADSGDVAGIDLALRLGACVNDQTHRLTPLMVAAAKDRADAVRALVAGGADVNQCVRGHALVETALHLAAARGRVRAIRALVATGADLECTDHSMRTPLQVAAGRADARTVAELLSLGADVGYSNGDPMACMAATRTDPHAAGVLSALVAAGAEVDRRGDGDHTALVHAIRVDAEGGAEALLHLGASANLAVQGSTPLHWAVGRGSLRCVRALLDAGADPCIPDLYGSTPIQVACSWIEAQAAAAINHLLRAAMAWRRRSAAVVACAAGMWFEEW